MFFTRSSSADVSFGLLFNFKFNYAFFIHTFGAEAMNIGGASHSYSALQPFIARRSAWSSNFHCTTFLKLRQSAAFPTYLCTRNSFSTASQHYAATYYLSIHLSLHIWQNLSLTDMIRPSLSSFPNYWFRKVLHTNFTDKKEDFFLLNRENLSPFNICY